MRSVVSVYLLAAVLVFGFGKSSLSAQASSCTITAINVNSSDPENIVPAGVNSSDKVTGSVLDLATFAQHGFIWSNGNGTLYDYPEAAQTSLGEVNNLGQSVGTYTNDQGQSFGFILNANGQTISFSVPGSYNTFAQGINEQGTVVGTWQAFQGGPSIGFLKQGNSYSTVQYPGAVSTNPMAVNDVGGVVGWYYDGTSEHGFLEFQNSYATIEPAGASSSSANGINDTGEIVGEYRPNANAEGRGFTYVNGAYTPYVYPNATYTELKGVNSMGDRVGDAVTGSNGFLTGPAFLLQCR